MNKLLAEGVSPSRQPDEEVEWNEVLHILHLCVQELSLIDQEVFFMRAVREDSYEHIMQVLNLPLGTVATKYNRAKQKIKTCLEKQGVSGVF